MDPAKLFNDLDSANNVKVEDARSKLVELFNHTKESFLVVGLIDYFATTSSLRVLEVLVKVPNPHDRFIFDKLSDLIRGTDRERKANKLTALEIFGYVVRSGPTWLYKVTQHQLMKDILKLLKVERDIVILMSALLSVVTLLPIVPTSIGQYLTELFEVFSHLAAWNEHGQRLSEEQLVHLQIGLFCLFQRLYGMYPNSFTEYIRSTYISQQKEKPSIFQHTIRPLLETVKIHPLLITGSREIETSQARWKKMEPHDVVFECARLSLEYTDRPAATVSECSRYITPIKPEYAAPNLIDLKRFEKLNLVNFVTSDNTKEIWSPSNVVYSTPPPTGVLSHTSTPTPNLVYSAISHINTSEGYSPPETAVEATPETTPLKDSVRVSVVPPSSTIVRAMWNNSQPSSPLKNAKFSYPVDAGASSRLLRMAGDRMAAASQVDDADDHEVRVINSRPVNIRGAAEKGPDDTLTGIELETEGSPCVEGGLHISNSRSLYEFANEFNRHRIASFGLEDFSAGTTPDATLKVAMPPDQFRLRRYNTWPRMNVLTGDLRSVSIAPKEKVVKQSSKLCQEIRKDLSGKVLGGVEDKGVQTAPTFHQPYDRMISDLFQEELRLRNQARKTVKVAISPQELLEQLIEACVQRQPASNGEQYYRESLNLLNLQLQYERHRREVHADRNRRLLGISRQIHQYEQNLNTLRDQTAALTSDNLRLGSLLNDARYRFNMSEEALIAEVRTWKQKCTGEQEENQRLRATIESLQTELAEAGKTKHENQLELEGTRGEMFDMKNELRQMALQVEMGQQYKDELVRLQSELLMMGELQSKCREKFSSIEQLEEKDAKLERLQESYTEEIKQLHTALDTMSGQLETTRARLSELESQITRRETTFTELKRDLKKTKEEYQERIQALEKKYTAQKSTILRMEEHILELYKTRSPVNLVALSPESERMIDIAGSLEHASSPLSLSQTSSDGLSASLKSITEIRNLQEIALGDPYTTATSTSSTDMREKSSPANIPSSSSRSGTLNS